MHVVTTHTQADFDGLASMLAVTLLDPQAIAAFSGASDRNVRDFLASGFLDFPVLRPGDIAVDEVTELSLVDTRTKSRIGQLGRCLDNPQLTLHLYDHHPATPEDLENERSTATLLLGRAGATTTLLIGVLQQRQIVPTPEQATLLALGIYEDTGSLTRLTTTADDLRAAAWLVEQGARLDVVNRHLSHGLSSAQVVILHELLDNARRYTIGEVPVVIATSASDDYVDNCAFVVSQLMEMENIPALFALLSMAGRIHLIARSRLDDINAAVIAADFGGGGHPQTASASISEITLIQAQEKLFRSLHSHIRPAAVAEEMMTSPAITVRPEQSISHAHRILVRYNITAAPVIGGESGTEPTGIISRQILERAEQHDLGERPVSDFMSSDFATLGPDATLADIQKIIIENRQRIIPIVDKTLRGIITRTDLLNRLVGDPAHLPQKLHDTEPDDALKGSRRNLNALIADSLSREMVLLLRTIGELADELGCRVYAVGGFVRDLLLRIKNFDLDIVVEGDGIAFAHSLANRIGGRCRSHERFKTAVVLLPEILSRELVDEGSFKVDIATARLEYYDSPAALPTVELSSIKLDLYRRDFTINAMAIQLNAARFGELLDFFHSRSDLKKRAVKTLHNLSFVEDPSRIFRAVRLEKRINFSISPHTRRLIRNAVEMDLFGRTDDLRYAGELKKILEEDNPLPALERLGEFELYHFLWPDLEPSCRIDHRFRHLLGRAWESISWHRLLFLEEPCRRWQVYLLVIMSRSQQQVLENFCTRFSESPGNRKFLLTQKKLIDRHIHHLHRRQPLKNSELIAVLADFEIEGLLAMMAMARKSHVVEALSLYIRKLRRLKPLLTGKDLIALGIEPGPQFKEIFSVLLAARADGLLTTADEERHLVQQRFCTNTA